MLGKLLGIFTVTNAIGLEIDMAELVAKLTQVRIHMSLSDHN